MPQRLIVVLTNTDSIVDKVRSAGGGASVLGVACLTKAGTTDQGPIIVIDPGAIQNCCIGRLREWSMQRPPRQVIYLCLPASPMTLFSLPQIHPGKVINLGAIEPVLRTGRRDTLTRSAWRGMHRLLSVHAGDDRRGRFVSMARTRHQRGLTVARAAAALDVGARQLSRLVREWFGYPPHVVLGLFRVECLTRDLRMTDKGLMELASMHGYTSRRTMSRNFRAYTGTTPRTFRFATKENRTAEEDVAVVPSSPVHQEHRSY